MISDRALTNKSDKLVAALSNESKNLKLTKSVNRRISNQSNTYESNANGNQVIKSQYDGRLKTNSRKLTNIDNLISTCLTLARVENCKRWTDVNNGF